jgi:hypothetical protein
MAVLGSNFANEIARAGLMGLPFTWAADGIHTVGPSMTPERVAALEALIKAHDPDTADPHVTAAGARRGGLSIISTASPEHLNGTYAIDPETHSAMMSEALHIRVSEKFSNGQKTKPWPDISGAVHVFTTEQFTALAEAVGQHLDALSVTMGTLLTGASAEWPAPSATIL